MKKRNFMLMILALVLASALVFTGCSDDDNGDVDIVLAGTTWAGTPEVLGEMIPVTITFVDERDVIIYVMGLMELPAAYSVSGNHVTVTVAVMDIEGSATIPDTSVGAQFTFSLPPLIDSAVFIRVE